MGSRLQGMAPASIFARPTADEIWLGPAQASALSQLAASQPSVCLSGLPATGRTTLLQRIQQDLARAQAIVLRLDTQPTSARAALSTLLECAGLNASHLSPIDQRNLLHLLVKERRKEGRRVLLTVDDADCLNDEVIDELERLARFSTGGEPAIEMRFAVREMLSRRRSAAGMFANGKCAELPLLTDDHVFDYIQWRLDRFSLPNLFTQTALRLARRYSSGTIRGIDSLCRLALLLMQRSERTRVDVQLINDAAEMLQRQRRAHSGATDAESTLQSPPDQSCGRVIVTEHGAPVMQLPLAPRILIGRAASNEICISSTGVSRYHALIETNEGRTVIIDLNSANGIFVNGIRVRQSYLNNHDVVTIGAFKLKLERLLDRRVEASQLPGLPDTVVLGPAADSPRTHLKIV